MGVTGTKKSTDKILSKKINDEIRCPICNKLFFPYSTYKDLNIHLLRCGKKQRSFAYSVDFELDKSTTSETAKKENKKRGSLPQRRNTTEETEPNLEENLGTIGDFQLVIDYNNTKSQNDIYEEKIKNIGKNQELFDKYYKLKDYLEMKKDQMNFNLVVNDISYLEIFKRLKDINIYYNLTFNIKRKNYTKENLTLEQIINKYFETMIKINKFQLINSNGLVSINFRNTKIDFEMIGIILAILLIYPEMNLQYKLPMILMKVIVKDKITLNDIKYENSELFHSLSKLAMDEKINELNVYYTCNGNELIVDGSKTKVNSSNVNDYIDKLINYKILEYKDQINDIKKGLFQFTPKKYILLFDAEELYQIINRLF